MTPTISAGKMRFLPMNPHTILLPKAQYPEAERLLGKYLVYQEPSPESKRSCMVSRFRGSGDIPENFVVTSHVRKSGNLTLFTSEMQTLLQLLADENPYLLDWPVVQLDDSGWGCPVGGTILGVLSPSGHVASVRIDVSFHRSNSVRETAFEGTSLRLIEDFGREGHDKIVVESCPTTTLCGTRAYLMSQGIRVRCAKISGLLQDTLKNEFREWLRDLGIPVHLVSADYNDISRWAVENKLPLESIKWTKILGKNWIEELSGKK